MCRFVVQSTYVLYVCIHETLSYEWCIYCYVCILFMHYVPDLQTWYDPYCMYNTYMVNMLLGL